MTNREKVIAHLDNLRRFADVDVHPVVSPENWNVYATLCDYIDQIKEEVEALLKEQEPREPHYTDLVYLIEGTEMIVHHPECPRCIENGLALWDAEIERGQAYCKRCGQAVKWNE